ncbi:MAG: sugar kinase [Proteobacteria bacterium]|nr:sugar kinase [Pseudomonadota bacterium]
MPEVVTLGESMAVLSPNRPGRLRNSQLLTLGVGGAETNVAVSLARLGVPSGWFSALGNDELGDYVLSTIRGQGVDCSRVLRSDAPTGLYLRDTLAGGTVRAFYYRAGSAASRLGAGDFDDSYLDGSKVLHVTGITLALSDSCRSLVHEAVAAARKRGVLVSLDVNLRLKLWGAEEARAAIEELLPQVDLVFVGDDEAQALWHASDPTLLDRLARFGPSEVVMKRGAAGAQALHDGTFVESTGFRVPVVDTVGAGDAFAAGYLAARIWGLGIDERLRYGNAMGAYCVSSTGDFENAPSITELKALLGERQDIGR